MCEERPKESTGRETNDPVSRCAEVIKSRQIFSLSRRVSDTYIILKGLFRGHYTREKRARSRGSRARAAARRTRFPRRAMSPRKVRARIKPGHFSGSSTPRFVLHAPPPPPYYCTRPSPPFIIPFHLMATHRSRRFYRGRALFTSANATSVYGAVRVSSLREWDHVRASRNPV